MTSLLNSELNLSNLLDAIMNVAKKVMSADACSLLLVDENNEELVFQIALSDVGEKIKTMTRLKIGECIAGSVAKTGEPLIIEDAYQHPKFNSDYDKKTGFETGSILCSPLIVKGEVMGACQVIHGKKRASCFSKANWNYFYCFAIVRHWLFIIPGYIWCLWKTNVWEKIWSLRNRCRKVFCRSPLHNTKISFSQRARMLLRLVGGDYYDFIPFGNDVLGIVLGDVSGKGVPATLQMARLMSEFRYISQVNPEPKKVLKQVNNIL